MLSFDISLTKFILLMFVSLSASFTAKILMLSKCKISTKNIWNIYTFSPLDALTLNCYQAHLKCLNLHTRVRTLFHFHPFLLILFLGIQRMAKMSDKNVLADCFILDKNVVFTITKLEEHLIGFNIHIIYGGDHVLFFPLMIVHPLHLAPVVQGWLLQLTPSSTVRRQEKKYE